MAKKIVEKKVELVKEVWMDVNESTKIRVSVSEFKGVHRVDIRKHIETEKYTGFTKDGVNVVTEDAQALYDALGKILETVKAENLFNAEEE